MFWHRTREEPAPPPEVAEDAAVPVTDGLGTLNWQDAVNALLGSGYSRLDCPGMCRRKGDHAHLRHEAAATDITVYPAVVERSGA